VRGKPVPYFFKIGEENTIMETISRKLINRPVRKVKIMQFGEGNFLRAFVDWIIQDLNDKGAIDGGVVVVQPMPFGRVADLAAQDGLYTLRLEGIDGGERVKKSEVIDVISDCLNPFTEYDKYLAYAKSEDLQVIISNTTEAGIAVDPTDTDFSVCPKSYPGKLLALLKARYDAFNGDMSKGLAIIPCELIDNNGDELYRCLTELAEINKMDKAFIKWMQTANHFTSTLVDRIVPGYPKNEIENIQKETGYIDNNVVKGEIFHLWVLKKEAYIQKVFPADSTGLNIIFADDIKPYKQRKVKILNGSHTAMVPVAYLCGIDTVGEAVNDPEIGKFVREFVFNEVNPTIKLPQDQMVAFANSVIERYQNPFVRHELMSIALNSTTKFRTRLLPTLTDYVAITGKLPTHLLFAFAALVEFHKGVRGSEKIELKDDPAYLEKWASLWAGFDGCCKCLAKKALGWTEAWGIDMNTIHPDITSTVAGYIDAIEKKGMRAALEDLING
jgi:tagaturonate reductase